MKKIKTTTKSTKSFAKQLPPPLRLAFYNYWTRRIEPFVPTYSPVGLYSCGPTVYNRVHIGNLRTFLFEDLLVRTLTYFGFSVRQVMNLTDVDDKTIRGAGERGISLEEFTGPWIEDFFRDLARLNIRAAHEYPRATNHVPEMISLIEQLIERGLAYQAEGSVFFSIQAFSDYGQLSRVDLANLQRGQRALADEYGKEAVQDFALWKAVKDEDEAAQAVWDSPWGRGRPGWHIECSAMSMKYLGETFDLHVGGIDLLFPHHEDEVAQSSGVTGQPLARFFLEVEHLLINETKMAKSAKNFYTLADVTERGFDPAAFRYLMLTTHYRSKLNFTWESLTAASQALAHIRVGQYRPAKPVEQGTVTAIEAALAHDLDTPKALALLQTTDNPALWRQFEPVLGLGLDQQVDVPEAVQQLVAEREQARHAKDFGKSDELRIQINTAGWEVEDTPDGPRLIPR
jgi:cysteinyl-tRNA synthetase